MKKLDVKVNQSIISILGRKLYQSEFSTVVLRELIQNSLDAGSSKIDIIFSDNELVVSDNGCGIEKIEGLLDTIGESVKSADIETIGGYGLAKLAIFGCKKWKFTSKSGSFSTGFIFDESEILSTGTMVSCEFTDNDNTWNFLSHINTYCGGIARNCQFTVNGDLVDKINFSICNFGLKDENLADTIDNGYIIVRVNGLPTFRQYLSGLQKTIYFDYSVKCNPYDPEYPLASNRDCFIQTSAEYQDLKNRKQSIQTKLETDKLLSENTAKGITETMFRNKKYLSGGEVTIGDYKKYSAEISTWERYIKQIASMYRYTSDNYKFGLTDGLSDEVAAYSQDSKLFLLSVGSKNKGEILGLALHEFVHCMGYGICGHDQSFASKLTEITCTVINKIYSDEFRK